MSWHQKSSRSPHDQCPGARNQAQNLEVAQLCKALAETSLSSHPPVSANAMEASEAGMALIPEGAENVCFSAFATTATSSSQSDVGLTSQEEASSRSSLAMQNPMNVPTPTYSVDEKVTTLVNFLLFKYRMKEPITKVDMLNTVIRECKCYYNEILLRASERMEMLFGIDMKEVDPVNHRYVLFIKLGLTYDGMMSGEEGVPKTSILILILGVILLKGNQATEGEIWEVLNLMGIYPGVKHFMFGDPKKIITDLVKEDYLVCQPAINNRPTQIIFLWGPRAFAETTKMKVLGFLAKVNGTDPSFFSVQYEEALREEEERARGRISARSEFLSMATAKYRSSSHT